MRPFGRRQQGRPRRFCDHRSHRHYRLHPAAVIPMALGDNKSTALILIRIAIAAVLFIHGAARISYGTVGGFGEFLGSQGLPLGFYVAWAITIFELVASVLLAVGFYTWIIALIFAAELGVGIRSEEHTSEL